MWRIESKDILGKIVICVCLTGAIYLYINTAFVIVLGVPLGIWLDKKLTEKRKDRRISRCEDEFRDFLCGLASELRSGKSLPNAFAGARLQVISIWGEHCAIRDGLRAFSNGLDMNAGIVDCCMALHREVGIKETGKFALIVKMCVGTGGDMIGAVSNCANEIIDKIQMNQETKQIIMERKIEQNILLVMPHALYWSLELMTPGYAGLLRTTVLGWGITFLALALWAGAWALSNRIIRKEL